MLKEEVLNIAHEILEQTQKEKEKYSNERQIIFNLIEDSDNKQSLEMLESLEKIYQKIKVLEKYQQIEITLKEIAEQQIRKQDEVNSQAVRLFCIRDKENKKYTFFSRDNAKEYLQRNKSRFNNDEIVVVENENMDLEILIKNYLMNNKKI